MNRWSQFSDDEIKAFVYGLHSGDGWGSPLDPPDGAVSALYDELKVEAQKRGLWPKDGIHA